MATKVIEQLIEADATRNNDHFGDHRSRHDYANISYSAKINAAMKRAWFAYGDLGYDGIRAYSINLEEQNYPVAVS